MTILKVFTNFDKNEGKESVRTLEFQCPLGYFKYGCNALEMAYNSAALHNVKAYQIICYALRAHVTTLGYLLIIFNFLAVYGCAFGNKRETFTIKCGCQSFNRCVIAHLTLICFAGHAR